MKTLMTTLLTVTALSLPSVCLANSVQASDQNASQNSAMQTFEVIYYDNIDIVAQQTAHTIQHLNYQQALEIQSQARNNINEIGARLHLINNVVAINSPTSGQIVAAK